MTTSTDPIDTPDAGSRFERWTSIFFLAVAVVTFLAALTVGAVAANDPAVPRMALLGFVGVAALDIGVLFVAAAGLDRRRAWGPTVAVGLLLVIVAADVVRVVVNLLLGQITIPLGGLVALYLLSTRAGPLPSLRGRDRWIAAVILALAVFAQVAAYGPGVVVG